MALAVDAHRASAMAAHVSSPPSPPSPPPIAGSHDMGRALGEATDLIAWFSATPPFSDRLVARTASFCTERSGHFDGVFASRVFEARHT